MTKSCSILTLNIWLAYILFALINLSVFIYPVECIADIYKYEDKDGVIHFSNDPHYGWRRIEIPNAYDSYFHDEANRLFRKGINTNLFRFEYGSKNIILYIDSLFWMKLSLDQRETLSYCVMKYLGIKGASNLIIRDMSSKRIMAKGDFKTLRTKLMK